MLQNDSSEGNEIVIGLIATVGTDTDEVIRSLKMQLNHFSYSVEEISVSKQILSQFEDTCPDSFKSEYERITHYMDLGNKVRTDTNDNSILMKGVARELYLKREHDDNDFPMPRNSVAYIIKSLKHPDEVDFMRRTYGDAFYLVGVTTTRERRLDWLEKRNTMSRDQAISLLDRDENEDIAYGQHTRDAFQHSDYFIGVDGNYDRIYNSVERFVDLLFGNPFITPNFDEYAMFMAYAASLRSADLSRQIGAVITKNTEILSMGVNDCPKYGGGLYWPILDGNGQYIDVNNGRDYMLGYDSNKHEQLRIIKNICKNLGLEATEDNVKKIKKAGIGDITEYGRVVHGEMEAILSCARNNISCRGATLYATTFPCHNCAKHIIAAGIERVVYIEPYPKSKAFDFYKNEITNDKSMQNRVLFEPFVGVGPQRYIDLFAMSSTRWYTKKRKDERGNRLEWSRSIAAFRSPAPLFNYLDGEETALLNFEDETVAIKKGDMLYEQD